MKTIKNRILEYFDRNQIASAAEISNTLGVTKPNIHYHIKNLIHSGVLEVFEKYDDRHTIKKGRPVIYYRKSNKSKATNFRILSENLLHLFLHNKNDDSDEEQNLYELAKRLAGDVTDQGGSLIQHLQNAVPRLEALNYEPHWEIATSGPVIYFRHCPYAEILSEFPLLCQVDVFLLEILTKISIKQSGTIHEVINRPPACIFVIKP